MSSPRADPGAGARGQALAADADARRLAQTVFDRPLVLEAGAGTGKTTTLVARALAWCLGPGWERHRAALVETSDPARELSPGELEERVAARVVGRVVAITFTEAAAAEMASRVGDELAAIASGEPASWLAADALPGVETLQPRARALAGVLDRLVVRTIHAYCRGLLADHPLDAGLHPELEVDADGRIAEEACREVVAAALATAYGEPGDASYLALAADGHGPQSIADTLEALLDDGARAEDLAIDPLAHDTVAAFLAELSAALDAMLECGAPLREVKRGGVSVDTLDALDATREALRQTEATSGGLERLRKRVEASWEANRLDRLKKWGRRVLTQAEAACLDDAVESACSAAGELHPLLVHLLRLAPERLEHGRRVLAPLLAAAREELRARGVLTFSDLLFEARRLLVSRPGLRLAVQRGIDQLLVDEFQDTDELQCDLLRALALAGPPEARPTLFLVGDPKQSIYGWRSADLAAYYDFVDEVRAAGGSVHALNQNFRSVPAILDEVRRAVEPVMLERSRLQAPFEPLVPCDRLAEESGFAHEPWAPVEHWVAWGREEGSSEPRTLAATATELEARAVAVDLLRLSSEHRLRFGDVALLLRSTGDLDVYLEALRRAGIPFAVGRDRHYYRRREIIDAASLVRTVLDPGDLVALVALLRSPMVAVPDAALAPLWALGFPRLVAELEGEPPAELEHIVEAAAAHVPPGVPGLDRLPHWPLALTAAVEHLGALRRSFRRDPADRFVEGLRQSFLPEVLESSRYLGRHRLANLDRFFLQLHAALAEGEDVPGVLRLLRRSVAEAEEAEEARPREASDDAVQVLTIHGAKGLDFEHVYLLQMHKGKRPRSAPKSTLERRGGAVEYCIFGAPTLGFARLEAEAEAVEAAERVRLLYVAMTRAKRRLVLTGCWPTRARRPEVEAAQTLLDLLAHRDPPAPALAELFAAGCDDGPDRLDEAASRWRFPALDRAPDPDPLDAARRSLPALAEVRREVERLGELRRAARERRQRPWSSPVSAEAHHRLERLLADDEPTATAEPAPAAPAQEIRAPSRSHALAVGAVVHRVLETLDLEAPFEPAWGEQRARLGSYAKTVAEPGEEEVVVALASGWLERLAESRLVARLRELGDAVLARELPIWLPASADDEALGFVSGVIDLVYRDPASGEVVIADFKTDEVGAAALGQRTAAYRPQGALYRRALAGALALPVAPRFELWYLYADRIVVAIPGGEEA